MAVPLSFNQERPKRERKYAKGLKYINRLFKIYFKDYALHKLLAIWIKFNSIKDYERILHTHLKDFLLPPELDLEKNLLFLMYSILSRILNENDKKIIKIL
ncbi:hypothetical protein [Candidatus Nanopusillus massiliensis]|uniref:hypothetical protein n=1 Tax=Candidatus Nanopusillus massiliensis TaxID=2897163 RepID=UPI001E613C35|nr:hypothetical protein [Candidatus Nanopusillus massiliensis]